jgi:hypothetical protein
MPDKSVQPLSAEVHNDYLIQIIKVLDTIRQELEYLHSDVEAIRKKMAEDQ